MVFIIYNGQAGVDYNTSEVNTTVTNNNTKTCNNIYCHSIAQKGDGTALTGAAGEYKTPIWDGGAMTCTSCHDNPPSSGSHTKHATTYSYTCQQCHSGYVPPANTHVNGAINTAIAASWSGTYNGDTTPGNGFSNCSNTYCHSNGTSVSTGTIPANNSANWGSGTLACNACHGNPPDYANGSPKANNHSAHSGYSCDRCHYNTTTTGTSITNYANHVNKAYNVDPNTGAGIDFTYAFSVTGGSCSSTSCHSNTTAHWGASACLGCHSVSVGSRAAITSQFSANSHHIQGVATTGSHCYQCHWEANSNGSINSAYHGGSASPNSAVDLVIYGAGTRPASYSLGTTAIQYTANGTRTEIQKINSHCLGCHSDSNNNTQPFGDCKTPRQYAWDRQSIASRYSQAGTSAWGKYSGGNITPKNTQTKAYSAHGNTSSNQRGWNTSETWPNTSGSINVLCFDCHNSHGSTVSGTTTSYTSATTNGGILKDVTSGKGGYSMTYKPQAGGSAENKNAYNAGAALCFDCHLTANAGTKPWGYSGTFGATQAILGYFDTDYFGPGTSGPEQRFSYKSKSEKGGHFGASSALSSSPTGTINGLCTPCHDPHGVSTTLGANQQYSVPILKGTWLTSPYKEDVAPANNTPGTVRDGTYPLGWDGIPREGVQYHIDQNTFGANIRASVTGITQTDTQFAGLCLNCHTKNTLTDGVNGGTWKSIDRIHESVKGWGANTKHNYPCSKCHTPHNSSLPRLMATNCLNNRHKGRVGYNPSPVLSGSGSGSYSEACSGLSFTLGFCGWSGDGYDYSTQWGAGSFPGSWRGDYPDNYIRDYTVTCHETNAADQSWNVKTQWVDDTPIITSGPSASTSLVGADIRATITWTTDEYSTSYVDYGLTPSYGSTAGDSTYVLNHSVTLTGLQNHSTYNYRVRSTGGLGTEVVSGNYTFTTSYPPYPPTLIDEPNIICSGSCSVTLEWNASTNPGVGAGPVEYYVAVDNTSDLLPSPEYNSGWISGTSWTSPALSTNTTWYWRVWARDATYTSAVSAWSTADDFAVSDGIAPPAPASYPRQTELSCMEAAVIPM